VFGSVRPCVSLCVPKTLLVNIISQKTNEVNFTHFGYKCILRFIDVLIRFLDQRSNVKATAGRRITVDGSPPSSI